MAQFKLLHYFDEEPIEPDFEMDFYVPIKINTIDIFRHLNVISSSALLHFHNNVLLCVFNF